MLVRAPSSGQLSNRPGLSKVHVHRLLRDHDMAPATKRRTNRRSRPCECDRYYRITIGDTPGHVSRAVLPRVCDEPPLRTGVCYEIFEGRSRPCAGCLAFESASAGAQRFGVLENGSTDVLRLVTVSDVGQGQADIAVRGIPRAAIPDLLAAHLSAVAKHSHLSPKELMVLDLLVMGRRPQEIATALGITMRTAKFHQHNLLEKLGADSRLDLVRILLLPVPPS